MLKVYSSEKVKGLPRCVQNFFGIVLQEGQPIIEDVYIEHEGTFNLSEDGENWKPFQSIQRVTLRKPGFNWEARIKILPGVNIWVRDAYVDGKGFLCAKLFGLIPLMSRSDSSGLAQGELMRFLAEAVWYPTALLPSQGAAWEELDKTNAKATLRDGQFSVSLTFTFNEIGLVNTVTASERYRDVDGKLVPTPWQGKFWNYGRCGGMLVPFDGEASWILKERLKPYWRGSVKRIKYKP
ncbi:DUF6544 family protein [Thermovirga sp.]|uniref:DUF6920 family protein n=1 Tax=Thermovirga sp. TaxID=2699834 RepID=UPI003458D7B6